jgi:hypothetical protein
MTLLFRVIFSAVFVFVSSEMVQAQAVPVREEPLHKPVFVNRYIRLLEVWLKPGDTSLYHIHEIPSVFCYLNTARYKARLEGDSNWHIVEASAGQSWYRSFEEGRLVHKVANPFDTALHVTDIELLHAWKKRNLEPLALPLLFPSDRVYAYQVNATHLSSLVVKDRGPIVAEVVKGSVKFHDILSCKSRVLNEGDYQYIKPGKQFRFSTNSTDSVQIVLFEIR